MASMSAVKSKRTNYIKESSQYVIWWLYDVAYIGEKRSDR